MESLENVSLPRMGGNSASADNGGHPHHHGGGCHNVIEMAMTPEAMSTINEAKALSEEAKKMLNQCPEQIKQTVESTESGGINEVEVRFRNGETRVFRFRNGKDGKDANITGANQAIANANAAAASAMQAAAAANEAAEDAEEAADTIAASVEGYAAAEASRVSAENLRVSAETARVQAESARVSAEADRATSETARRTAETARTESETSRASAESARSSAETSRVAAEAARVAAEQARVQAESQRSTSFQNQLSEQDQTFQQKESQRDAAMQTIEQSSQQLEELAQQVNTAIGGIDSKVDAKVETEVAPIREEVKKLNDLFGNGVEGYVRVSGTSDPSFNYKHYSRGTNVDSVFDCLKPCLVGNNFTGHVGEILHILEPLNWYKDIYGDARKIDGSEGEVLICNVRSIWEIAQHVKVGDVTYDVFLRSYTPFEWMGTPSTEIKPMGIAPHFCVAHKDDDNVTRMHSAYNMEWNGSYTDQHTIVGKFVQTQNEDGTISETYDADGAIFGGAGGLHSTDISLIDGEQYAMNINEDTTKTYPYFNATARAEELMFAAMVAEGGTFDAHHTSLMGSGFSCNDSAASDAHWAETEASARNGFRYQNTDGTWVNMNISKRGKVGFNAAKTGDNQYTCCYLNVWRSPWRVMEQQRVMMYAIEHNVPELTWFAVEGNKYKWRHVEGFAGPSEGAMTAVVWKLFATKFGDGCVDPTTSLDVSGLRCEYLFCSAIYRGRITDVSPSWWTSGLIFTEDSDGTYQAYMERDQRKLIKSISATRAKSDSHWSFEDEYDHVGEFNYGSGYRKDYNDGALMMPNNKVTQSGAGLHTYVGGYQYLTGAKPSAVSLVVRGFRRGLTASSAYLSPLFVYGFSTPGYANPAVAFGICCEIANSGS